MNKEEIKAIDYLTKYINWDTYGERSLETDIETVLNLIEKQQKEIEKLKDKNKKYQGIENGSTIIYKAKAKYVREDRIEKYYVDKNKIRDFIKNETYDGSYSFSLISAKKLEELLEED